MDLSNISNPYDELLRSLEYDRSRIQAFYEAQWNELNSKATSKLLDDSFKGMQPDQILVDLLNKPGYEDPRNVLCIWARPSVAVKELVLRCQSLLKEMSPNIWLTPQDCLHMTVLVVAYYLTPGELAATVPRLMPSLRKVAGFHEAHRARLVKPRLSFSDSGVALSYVPAAGEITDDRAMDESYTYLHLRRDIFNLCRGQVLDVNAQHPPTSCHITVARFVTTEDHSSGSKPDHTAIAAWVSAIEKINEMIAMEYWPRGGTAPEAGNWIIGEDRGLDIREGTTWYGGGRSLEFPPGP
ncbi:uncharacterized protein NFIA_106800 [Aspergillus fischeri NRRL 181]|uniref:RNA ligase/cyclic nucleotide phosphodiesterase n=1 Tax=Neosartorya fischeri (strain ATCC 1020 / DSM 3700 / CBS 544.65 / FGSC A1164 / JCM 1740 / NRRL 181 / WB 181) TaxID=331117 RepID=A1CX39_NEOFI|nr:conserved hypothetical protein [Aspergillus fischeri NRRL 181]EAW25191.1 conserved hypothetical protein [Aspergillus fischeri NRRL 181]KAG2027026.1 hypothetical protein GB937_000762 [Aspergillus fischeri]